MKNNSIQMRPFTDDDFMTFGGAVNFADGALPLYGDAPADDWPEDDCTVVAIIADKSGIQIHGMGTRWIRCELPGPWELHWNQDLAREFIDRFLSAPISWQALTMWKVNY